MCRGCDFTKNGEPTTYEYLQWFDKYLNIIYKMKDLEKEVLEYSKIVDRENHRKGLDGMHKALIKTRKQYASIDSKYLNEISNAMS